MAEVSVFNMEGQEVGKIDLADGIFGAPIKSHLVHQAVVLHLANMRQGTQKAKTRHARSARKNRSRKLSASRKGKQQQRLQPKRLKQGLQK